MAHHSRVRAPGLWLTGGALDPSELEGFDARVFASINGDAGGTWAPLAPIVIGGLGLDVSGPLDASDVEVFDVTGVATIKAGGSLEIEAGCTFDTLSHLRCFEGLYVGGQFCISTEIGAAAGTSTMSNGYGHRVPLIGSNVIYVLPDPTEGMQHQLVTRVRTDAFTVTVQRADGQVMGVIPSGQAGWIECVSRSASDNQWVVSKWSSNITSLYNGISS